MGWWSNKSDDELARLVASGKATPDEYKEYKNRMSVAGSHRGKMFEEVKKEASKSTIAWPFGKK